MATHLCPAQQKAFEQAERILRKGNIGVVFSKAGRGRTTVLHALHESIGGAYLTLQDFMNATRNGHPLALEETFFRLVMEALQAHETVIVDDLHLLGDVLLCNHFYARQGFLHTPLSALVAYAIDHNKKLVFGTKSTAPEPIHQRCYYAGIESFQPEDYEFLCRVYLGEREVAQLDYGQVHRFAPKLNAHQLHGACTWMRDEPCERSRDEAGGSEPHQDVQKDRPALNTERFVDYLRSQHMASNVSLQEVRAVNLRDLKGVDDVIESLEANIIVPLENDELATELNLKPRRGVLLVGPPGTGKTTIGRALAHRLKSKFFLIDGTFIAGTREFYGRIREVFEVAKQNAPSVIFIDDGDAIFEGGEEQGLYRYLLTMLDGLESESAGRVCVVMTVMDVGHLPPALIRSGRIELWLETRLPDAAARTDILQSKLHQLPASIGHVAEAPLVEATEGFTGADLDRLIEDGKALIGYDRARGRALQSTTEYFLAAVETVRANKERYAVAEARSRQRPAGHSARSGFLAAMAAADAASADAD